MNKMLIKDIKDVIFFLFIVTLCKIQYVDALSDWKNKPIMQRHHVKIIGWQECTQSIKELGHTRATLFLDIVKSNTLNTHGFRGRLTNNKPRREVDCNYYNGGGRGNTFLNNENVWLTTKESPVNIDDNAPACDRLVIGEDGYRVITDDNNDRWLTINFIPVNCNDNMKKFGAETCYIIHQKLEKEEQLSEEKEDLFWHMSCFSNANVILNIEKKSSQFALQII